MWEKLRIPAMMLAAGVAPVAAILILGLAMGDPAGPDFSLAEPNVDAAAATIGNLSETLINLSIGVCLASLWLFRQPIRKNGRTMALTMAMGGLLLAISSIYAGARFQYQLTLQLTFGELDLYNVVNPFYWQATFLVTQIGLLCASGVGHYALRDRRFDKD